MKYDDADVQFIEDTLDENHDVVDDDVLNTLMAELNVNERSICAKLRSMDYEVPKKSKGATFTEQETAEFATLAAAGKNAEEIAEALDKTVKQVRGKALSMKATLTPSPKKATAPKKFSDEETKIVGDMAEAGNFLEEIAEAVGKTVPQVRGKLLSMSLKAPQRDRVEKVVSVVYTEDKIAAVVAAVKAGSTAEEIADTEGLNLKGVKSRIGKLLKEGLISELPSDMGHKVTTKVDYTEELIAQITALAETHTSQEAADELEIPVASLRAKAGKEGIKFQKSVKATAE